VACGRITRSPSKRGSSVSTRRLKGAYFSRAMRSQVSSTESKVSREWSAKRSRCSSDSARQPVVQQEVERSAESQHLEDAGGAHAAADAHRHALALPHTRLAPRRLPSISAWPVRRWPLTP
jgi:hypothetical protein